MPRAARTCIPVARRVAYPSRARLADPGLAPEQESPTPAGPRRRDQLVDLAALDRSPDEVRAAHAVRHCRSSALDAGPP